MANDVFANGREVSCKKADGKSICAFPDVCFTPPQTPATPPGVPIPYPNTGFAKDTKKGSKSVKITKKEVMLKNKSYFKKSTGDEAGCASKKGVITSTNKGKVYFTSWSMDVKFEGKNVVRHLDLTTHNHRSFPGNSPPWAYTDTQTLAPIEACKTETEKAKDACKDKKTKDAQCADKKCKAAKKCLLVTYNQGKRKGKKSNVACCDGEQPHHLVESHSFCEEGARGTPLPQFSSPPYNPKNAPCVCAIGDRFSAEHGAFHALQGKKESAAVKKAPANQKDYAWNYGDAKAAGINAHKNIFPGSNCSKGCLEAQLDSYHKGVGGVENNTPVRTYDASKNLQDWQKGTNKQILAEMKNQLGGSHSGV
jgi:hypothetical protein